MMSVGHFTKTKEDYGVHMAPVQNLQALTETMKNDVIVSALVTDVQGLPGIPPPVRPQHRPARPPAPWPL